MLIVDTPVAPASLLHSKRGDRPEYTSMPPYKKYMRNQHLRHYTSLEA